MFHCKRAPGHKHEPTWEVRNPPHFRQQTFTHYWAACKLDLTFDGKIQAQTESRQVRLQIEDCNYCGKIIPFLMKRRNSIRGGAWLSFWGGDNFWGSMFWPFEFAFQEISIGGNRILILKNFLYQPRETIVPPLKISLASPGLGHILQSEVWSCWLFDSDVHNGDCSFKGRYLFLNAIANQLRYPNSHTHYFSCTLLYLFAEANQEAIQEQITR